MSDARARGPVPPGISTVVHDAVADSLAKGAATGISQRADRFAVLVTGQVVNALIDRWPEIAADEVRRAWDWATSRAAWEIRGWCAARVAARCLPRDVVAHAMKRVIVETCPDDPYPLSVPIGVYADRWDRNGRR